MKRVISLMLALAMLVALLPAITISAFAVDYQSLPYVEFTSDNSFTIEPPSGKYFEYKSGSD